MSYRRREGLGRNRGGPSTRNYVPHTIAAMAVFIGLAIYGYSYFTAPPRVFGSKRLKCPPHEITFVASDEPDRYLITGCDKSIEASCHKRGTCFEKSDVPIGHITFP